MADTQTPKAGPRRRVRSMALFNPSDHGESTQQKNTRAQAASMKLRWRPYLRLIRIVTQVVLILFATLTLGGILLRFTGFLCKFVPFTTTLCTNTASQEPLLARYSPGTTPTTNALEELTKVNEIASSVQMLGLVMGMVTYNLKSSYDALYSYSESCNVTKEELENLVLAVSDAQSEVESVVDEEYFFRQGDLFWNTNGLGAFGVGVQVLKDKLAEKSDWGLAFRENSLHRIPFGARWTLAAEMAKEYFWFSGEQQLAVKDQLLNVAGMGMILGNLVGLIGGLERRLERVVEERKHVCGNEVMQEREKLCLIDQSLQLRTAVSMRLAVQWCQAVAKVTEERYKSLYSELSRTTKGFAGEMNSYRTWFPSKRVLPLKKLRKILETERKQIDEYVKTARMAEDIVDSFSEELMRDEMMEPEGEALNTRAPKMLLEAIPKREVYWWY